MFSNYTAGVQVGNNCNHHSCDEFISSGTSFVNVDRDDFGNITGIQWIPDARFALDLTSQIHLPIPNGSQIINKTGGTPEGIVGWEGLLAYNVIDIKCWRYCNDTWNLLPDLVSGKSNNTVVSFGNPNASTRVVIRNFRGEPIFSVENQGISAQLVVDDNLSEIVSQGFYYVDIYQITDSTSRLIRHFPLSVTAVLHKDIKSHTHHCQSNNLDIVTDYTLALKNNILSVNVSDICTPGDLLPISSDAVFAHAQPRTRVLEIDLDKALSSMTSIEIYEHMRNGGEVICFVDKKRFTIFGGDALSMCFSFKEFLEDSVYSILLFIDAQGKVTQTDYSFSLTKTLADMMKEYVAQDKFVIIDCGSASTVVDSDH